MSKSIAKAAYRELCAEMNNPDNMVDVVKLVRLATAVQYARIFDGFEVPEFEAIAFRIRHLTRGEVSVCNG